MMEYALKKPNRQELLLLESFSGDLESDDRGWVRIGTAAQQLFEVAGPDVLLSEKFAHVVHTDRKTAVWSKRYMRPETDLNISLSLKSEQSGMTSNR